MSAKANEFSLFGRLLPLMALFTLITSCLPQQVGPVVTPSIQKSPVLTKSSTQTSEATITPTLILTATFTPTTLPSATVTTSPTPLPFTGLVPPDARLRISKGGIRFDALTPDGKDVVIASSIILCSYRLADGSENWCHTTGDIRGSAMEDYYDGLAVSPDGQTLVIALQNGNIVLWDRATGEQKLLIQTNLSFMSNLDWSPDGQKLAITTGGNASTPSGVIRIFDSRNGRLLQKLASQYDNPSLIRWSPDGKFIAGAGSEVTLFDVASTSAIFRKTPFTKFYSSITNLEWSADGTMVLAGSRVVSCMENCYPIYDGEIIFLDARSGDTIRQIDVGQPVNNLAPSPDGKLLLADVGQDRRETRLYRSSDMGLVRTISLGGVSYLPLVTSKNPFWFADSQRFLTLNGNDNLAVWDISGVKQSEIHLDNFFQITGIAWSPDASQLATNSYRGIFIWDPISGQILRKFGIEGQYEKIAWSPDGKTLASLKDRLVYFWDAKTGVQLRLLTTSGEYPRDLGWSTNGRLFASLSLGIFPVQNAYIDIWNADNWTHSQLIKIENWQKNEIQYFAWSPDGKTLAAAGFAIFLWDAASGKLINTFAQDVSLFSSISWSSDGQNILAGDFNGYRYGSVIVVDAGSGAVRVWIKSDEKSYITSAAFSPDGKLLVTGGDHITLYDAQDGKLLKTLNGFANLADRLAFRPDGRTLASGSEDGTVILWFVQPSDTFPLAPTATGTAVPAGVFPLLLYPPLVLNYDPAIWEDISLYGNPDRMVNILEAQGMATCQLSVQGPTEFNIDFPSEMVTLGTITYEKKTPPETSSGASAFYIDDKSLSEYDYSEKLPVLVISADRSEWEACRNLGENVLATLHTP